MTNECAFEIAEAALRARSYKIGLTDRDILDLLFRFRKCQIRHSTGFNFTQTETTSKHGEKIMAVARRDAAKLALDLGMTAVSHGIHLALVADQGTVSERRFFLS